MRLQSENTVLVGLLLQPLNHGWSGLISSTGLSPARFLARLAEQPFEMTARERARCAPGTRGIREPTGEPDCRRLIPQHVLHTRQQVLEVVGLDLIGDL